MRKIKLGIVGLGRGSCAGEQIRRRCRFLEITAICDKNENVLRTRTASFGAADAKLPISGFSFSLSWIIVVRILVNMPVPERLAYGQSQMLSHNI